MADNDHNDEYQFADLDLLTPNPDTPTQNISDDVTADLTGDPEKSAEGAVPHEGEVAFPPPSQTKRKVIAVVILFILLVLAYKLIEDYRERKSSKQQAVVTQPVPVETTFQQQSSLPTPETDAQSQQLLPPGELASPPQADPMMNQRLSALEDGQQSLNSEMNSVNSQLSGISQNVTQINTQINQLNSAISELGEKLAQQSQAIETLIIKSKPKVVSHKARMPAKKYYIQALIPGRAWLIDEKGSTLTVREGTILAGYGVIKMIDAIQGRVLTSSGQTIRFSQADS